MTLALPNPTAHSAYKAGAWALLIAAAAILGALGFQYLGGIEPCELCLKQRWAYYAGVPVLFAALVLLSADQRRLATLLFALVAVAFLGNAVLGVYHAGVEWHFWPGPEACTGAQPLSTSVGGLLNSLPSTNVVRCDEAAWRFAGISLAGWNVVVSLLVLAMSLRAAAESVRSR
ncbi:MAG: disulfide bond formation protein B [Burkholderiales bacterium]|jgi:disulfide bond formation protein DsbB